MKLLIISDTHDLLGFQVVYRLLKVEHPDGVLSCGDWGNYAEPRQHVLKYYTKEFLALDSSMFRALFNPILSKVYMYTLYGNHDSISDLAQLHNRDGSPCLLPSMVTVKFGEIALVGINGNFAHRPRFGWHVTAEELRQKYAEWQKKHETVDVVLSHEAVAGYADSGKGQAVLKEVCDDLKPKYWFNGHIHRAAAATTPTGTTVTNIGITLHGDYTMLDTTSKTLTTHKRSQETTNDHSPI